MRRGLAPDLEAGICGGERAVEIGARGMRHVADALRGRRIEDRLAFAFRARDPFAVDVKLDLRIHADLLPCRFEWLPPSKVFCGIAQGFVDALRPIGAGRTKWLENVAIDRQ